MKYKKLHVLHVSLSWCSARVIVPQKQSDKHLQPAWPGPTELITQLCDPATPCQTPPSHLTYFSTLHSETASSFRYSHAGMPTGSLLERHTFFKHSVAQPQHSSRKTDRQEGSNSKTRSWGEYVLKTREWDGILLTWKRNRWWCQLLANLIQLVIHEITWNWSSLTMTACTLTQHIYIYTYLHM